MNGMVDVDVPVPWQATNYLTSAEIHAIRARFESVVSSSPGRLVFWTGIAREFAQRWADRRDMFTLTSLMGPLMDIRHPSYPWAKKSKKQWKNYVKGASGLFAEHACSSGTVTVLIRSPEDKWTPRRNSTYRQIEGPILRGEKGIQRAKQIVIVHPNQILNETRQGKDHSIVVSSRSLNTSKSSTTTTKESTTKTTAKCAKDITTKFNTKSATKRTSNKTANKTAKRRGKKTAKNAPRGTETKTKIKTTVRTTVKTTVKTTRSTVKNKPKSKDKSRTTGMNSVVNGSVKEIRLGG